MYGRSRVRALNACARARLSFIKFCYRTQLGELSRALPSYRCGNVQIYFRLFHVRPGRFAVGIGRDLHKIIWNKSGFKGCPLVLTFSCGLLCCSLLNWL